MLGIKLKSHYYEKKIKNNNEMIHWNGVEINVFQNIISNVFIHRQILRKWSHTRLDSDG